MLSAWRTEGGGATGGTLFLGLNRLIRAPGYNGPDRFEVTVQPLARRRPSNGRWGRVLHKSGRQPGRSSRFKTGLAVSNLSLSAYHEVE